MSNSSSNSPVRGRYMNLVGVALLPLVGILMVIGVWAFLSGTVAPSLPSPFKTWEVSRLYIFEHNPFNPVTTWVVKHTPIDRNAVLINAPTVRRGLRSAGFDQFLTRYLMFFPPRFTWLEPGESLFRRVPLGGQFVVRARPV